MHLGFAGSLGIELFVVALTQKKIWNNFTQFGIFLL
jgi:hypothetical protein